MELRSQLSHKRQYPVSFCRIKAHTNANYRWVTLEFNEMGVFTSYKQFIIGQNTYCCRIFSYPLAILWSRQNLQNHQTN